MKAKRKILFILHLPPPIHGAAMVGKYIHDSKTINEQFECRYINLTTASSLEEIGKVSYGKLKAFIHLLSTIRRQVEEFHPYLVYVTPNAKGGAFYKDFIVVQMLKIMGCRVVAHYHNKGVCIRQDRWFENLLYQRFFKGIKVILLGKSLYNDVAKYVRWEDVYICPNGIPVDKVVKEKMYRVDDKTSSLLFLSNLIESKGVLILLDALKILKDKGYSFICDFVGGETKEIDAKQFNEEVNKRSLGGFAIYQGQKYGEEKHHFLEQSDIFVLPTINDCFPLVLLEAMECSLPCISTSEGAIGDIIKDGITGLIVERNSVSSLSRSLEVLLNDKEKRLKMGTEGNKVFKEKFTLDIFENNICRILKSIYG